MSNKNNKNVNETVNTVEVNTTEVAVEETKETFGTKFKAGVKKHGKKALGIAAGIGVGVLGFALGAKFGHGESADDGEAYDYAAEDYAAVEEE